MSRKGSSAFGVIIIVFCAIFLLVLIVKFDLFNLEDDGSDNKKPYVSDKILLLDYAENELEKHVAYHRDPRSGICFALHGVQYKGHIAPYAVDVSAVPCTRKVKAEIERQKRMRNPSAYKVPKTREPITIEVAPDAPPLPALDLPIIITEPAPKDATTE